MEPMEPLEAPDDPRIERADLYRALVAGAAFVALTAALLLWGMDGLSALWFGLCAGAAAHGLLALQSGRLLLVTTVLVGTSARVAGAALAALALGVAAFSYA